MQRATCLRAEFESTVPITEIFRGVTLVDVEITLSSEKMRRRANLGAAVSTLAADPSASLFNPTIPSIADAFPIMTASLSSDRRSYDFAPCC